MDLKDEENFIQNKYGYCFYTLNNNPEIYNLYIHPIYRNMGHSRKLIRYCIDEILLSGYTGKINIQVKSKCDIGNNKLKSYYESFGLNCVDYE